MDLSASSLLSGLAISSLGMFFLLVGKRAERPLWLLVGGAMCVYPYFIANVAVVWLVAAVLMIPVWAYRHG